MTRAERIVRSLIESNLSLDDLTILANMISECEDFNEEHYFHLAANEAHIIWNELYNHIRENKK
jgi:hypothetical protein